MFLYRTTEFTLKLSITCRPNNIFITQNHQCLLSDKSPKNTCSDQLCVEIGFLLTIDTLKRVSVLTRTVQSFNWQFGILHVSFNRHQLYHCVAINKCMIRVNFTKGSICQTRWPAVNVKVDLSRFTICLIRLETVCFFDQTGKGLRQAINFIAL